MFLSSHSSTYRHRSRPLSSDYKLKTYLRIARLYLEDDDPVQADVFINRASLLQNETRDEELQILYRVSVICSGFGYPR